VSDTEIPPPPPPEEPEALLAGELRALEGPPVKPSRPVLAATPGWVPAAVVAGAVLLAEGAVVHQIQAGEGEGTPRIISDVALASAYLGLLSLVAGYFAYLLSRVRLDDAIAALVLTAVTAAAYGLGALVLLDAIGGRAADLFFVRWTGLAGNGAKVAAIGGLLLCGGIFGLAFWLTVRIVWPWFRAGVALNVLTMVHLVILLLGVVSYLNHEFTPHWLGTGADLTETRQYSLSDKTRAILGKVEGELLAFLVDYGGGRRSRDATTTRVQDLLREFQAACPRISYRTMDALRKGDQMQAEFQEAGLGDALSQLTGEDDCVVLGYRPTGEKLVVRTKVVPVNEEFRDRSALGNERFRGEGILANAMNEVVFVQRHVAFLEGHGERPLAGGAPMQSLAALAEALRNDNFSVKTLNLAKEAGVPAETDLVVVAAPTSPIPGTEAEALRAYLREGGSLVLLLEPAVPPAAVATGLEDVLASFGLRPRRDGMIVSYVADRAFGRVAVLATREVMATRDEYGRHASMEALRSSGLVTVFSGAAPVFREETIPEGVTVEDLVYAPREVQGMKPFVLILREGRSKDMNPQPGDIVDKRLPVAATAERKVGGSEKGGGRVLVFGDADFLSDLRLDPRSPAVVPANRTLFLNAVSWAVRRDLIAIDPKTVETEFVTLRPIDRALSFWVTVMALPLLALGVAVGVWWSRRR